MVVFHGTLDVTVKEARGLHGGGCCSPIPDPYVKAYLGKADLLKTDRKEDTLEPKWEENFTLQIATHAEELIFKVKSSTKPMGTVKIKAATVVKEQSIDKWYTLAHEHLKRSCGELHLVINFIPASSLEGGDLEVKKTYFPMRKNCKVKMYQDAIVYEGQLPQAPLSNGNLYSNGSCWEELYQALGRAEKFIYATGWSFWVHTVLIRKEYNADSHFGNLLAKKAESGLTVLMLIWDDQTSGGFMSKEGMMGTKDEETREFFSKSKVNAQLVARETDSKTTGVIKKAFSSSVYTHHQKSIIFDQMDEDTGKRKIVAFVGGLDVTTGRYDTPDHRLFSTLKTEEHKDDFYSNCIPGVTAKGPRQPWHDIHGRVDGPIARDVMRNFEERWRKQASAHVASLIKPEELDIIAEGEEAKVTSESDPETWNVQYFRSIDERSAVFERDPKKDKDVFFSKKGRSIDASIQSAYAHYIRTAQKFIYIENQYFLGSSSEWRKSMFKDSLANMEGATHIVPMEITLKIVQKIKAGEHFCAYIVVPLFPEGLPESGAVQEILCWQRNTVQLMYHHISEALKQNKDKHPGKKATDFLSIFALGNREYPPEDAMDDEVAKQGRHMIYVHSKMIIVDDSVILMGSANINQRSMDGGRDTEMAFGAYQPNYTVQMSEGELPKGQVHGFRMSLFAEHLGFKLEPWMTNPSLPEAMRTTRDLAEKNWKAYADTNLQEMPGHLMLYPYNVDSVNGTVFADPLNTNFPGTEASVMGKEQKFMPDSATM